MNLPLARRAARRGASATLAQAVTLIVPAMFAATMASGFAAQESADA
jgi:hypothetical protein